MAVAIGIMIVIGFALGWSSLPAAHSASTLAVPSFASQDGRAAAPPVAPRSTLLPTDCADVLTGPADASALLAQPTGSVGVHTVLGLAAPSVGLLERVSCAYQRGGQPSQLLGLNLAAFSDPRSADDQRLRNIAAERGDTRSATPVSLGGAKALLLAERTGARLMVAYDRYTVTATLPPGVVADAQAGPVLVDLVRRVLPTLPPPSAAAQPGTPPAPTRH
jgi:hypothetical protein